MTKRHLLFLLLILLMLLIGISCTANQSNATDAVPEFTSTATQENRDVQLSSTITTTPTGTNIPIVPTIGTTATSLPPTITATPTELLTTGSTSGFGAINLYSTLTPAQGKAYTVFWSDDGNQLYYALEKSHNPVTYDPSEFEWFVYDMVEQDINQIETPPPHDRTYEIRPSGNRIGLSPTGRYYLETVLSDPLATPPDDPYACRIHDIMLVDTLTDNRSLVKKETCFGFTTVYWALAENRYYFGEGGDGLNSSSYAVVGHKAESLGPVDGRISPDGEWLLYYSHIFYTMHLKNLSTGEHIELKNRVENITWSLNSDFFYTLTRSGVWAYEIAMGEYFRLVDMFEIWNMGLCEERRCFYAVAPDHKSIVVYVRNNISIVTLP